MAQRVKNPAWRQETWVGKMTVLGRFPWRRAWQPTPVFLPEESPWTEVPGGLQSMGLQRVGHDWATMNSTAQHVHKNSAKSQSTVDLGVAHLLTILNASRISLLYVKKEYQRFFLKFLLLHWMLTLFIIYIFIRD